jgi:hypothetical protein
MVAICIHKYMYAYIHKLIHTQTALHTVGLSSMPMMYDWPAAYQITPAALSDCVASLSTVPGTLPLPEGESAEMYVCATGALQTNSHCSYSPLFGTMLIATPQGKPSVLVGLLSRGNACEGSMGAYVRVDSARQWALSVMGVEGQVFHPQVDFNFTIKSVSTPASWMVKVHAGAVKQPMPSIFTGGCREESTVIKDQGKGAFLVEFEVEPCQESCEPVEFIATWKAEGCASHSHSQCIIDNQCMWLNEACQENACTLDLDWKEVLQMVKRGDAFTAGLGKKAIRTWYMEMVVWVCVRDWNATSQSQCGVGPRDFACFGYEEKSKKFLPLGPNSARKLVQDVPEDKDSMDILWALSGVTDASGAGGAQ